MYKISHFYHEVHKKLLSRSTSNAADELTVEWKAFWHIANELKIVLRNTQKTSSLDLV